MGFFDEYPDEGGAAFLSSEEKTALVKSGKVVKITNVYAFTDAGQYPGPAYMVILDVDDEERKVSFKRDTNVDSRDRQLANAIAWFAEHPDEPIEVVLSKAGNAFLFKPAGE